MARDRGRGRLPVEVVLPVRWTDEDPDRVAELGEHLRRLADEVRHVTVVDGSPEPLWSRHVAAWAEHARVIAPAPVEELWPDHAWVGRNGKVVGAWTGVLAARSELVVLTDDDVRHTRSSLGSLVAGLEQAALVRPVTVYDSWPWQARWDGARTLINVAVGAEWPGTLAVRRKALIAAGGWCPDVLFENLELWRTLEARGHRVVASDLVVRRSPPSVRHFWSQRIRQAYDDFAQPGRLALELALLPGLVVLARRRPEALLVVGLGSVALASVGRLRIDRTHVPAPVALWAPVWVLERSVCAWLALACRLTGGVPYCGRRMPLSAHSLRALRRAASARAPSRRRSPTTARAGPGTVGGERHTRCMQRIDGHLVLSPTDLTKHVACPHITTLDLAALDGEVTGASGPDDALNLVFQKGLDHEHRYLDLLREQGRSIEDIAALGVDKREAEAATVDAMRRGVDVIYQATFFDGHWVGYADFLLRVDEPSGLGGWRYDIADTKLARRLKVPALLQMATYAARLETLQGVPPRWLTVVTGDREQHPWRLVDVAPYARRRREELLDAIANPRETESARVEHCAQCRWRDRCAQEWLDRDDLVQVAGMRADHRAALRAVGIETMQALAEATEEQLAKVLGSGVRGRLLQQARLQVLERATGRPHHELVEPPYLRQVDHEGNEVRVPRGLALLPEPDEGDVYLDFEGDPWAEDGAGREYLAGIWTRQEEFVGFWAHDFAQEGRLTRDLVDWLTARWERYPSMHVYHYAPYETTALKRLVGQHATREAELDQLLRHEVFVDLYAVVRQGVRISKGSYSIKKLEDFYWGHTRRAEGDAVADGLSSVVEYEEYLRGLEAGAADQSILDRIRDYNEVDVRSTLALHEWLEQLRVELAARGHALSRPCAREAKEIGEAERAEIELTERLVASGHELLAGCVGWHRREQRPEWWDYFRYRYLETDELIEDGAAIGGITGVELVEKVKRSNVWRYTFPPQECKAPIGQYTSDVDTLENVGKVIALDPQAGWVTLSMAASKQPPTPRGLGKPGPVRDEVLRDSIARTGELVLAGGGNLATRLLDRVVPAASLLAVREGESAGDAVVRVGRSLNGEVLAVQGPPGTGKTRSGSALIRALLDDGLRVGVTAQSHAVILNLLGEVGRPALHKDKARAEPDTDDHDEAVDAGSSLIVHTGSNDEIAGALASGAATLVGGTAWLWSRPEMSESVDVLVVDEAGQFALANAVAVAPSARSLVLLGDPQQLTQPTKAVHPFGSGVSALDHLLGGHDVIPPDVGVFLPVTFRMHPALSSFVSELAYEGRLHSAQGRERLAIDAPGALAGDGLRWVPVEHTVTCAQSSEQEAAVVASLVEDLLRGEWVDAEGMRRALTIDDLLVVAPYNAHVATLLRALPPGAKVGTVDKFQGQQAAVVIYSMASTSAVDAPRGVSFLYDVHRLNVAISRAKAMAVVVGSPLLLDAAVSTPQDLRAVNALCRYVDEAKAI